MSQVKRYHLINHLIKFYGYQSYLEVGTRDPRDNFNKIMASVKESIDPEPLGPITYKMTSDEAFKKIKAQGKTYDLIFIDGLHLEAQVDKDIENGLEVLNPNGTIVMHDCNPVTEFLQREEYIFLGSLKPFWNGTVWKSLVKLRHRLDLAVEVVDTDWGCGIIRKGTQRIYDLEIKPEYLQYPYLVWHRKELLNLITVEEFVKKYSINYQSKFSKPSIPTG